MFCIEACVNVRTDGNDLILYYSHNREKGFEIILFSSSFSFCFFLFFLSLCLLLEIIDRATTAKSNIRLLTALALKLFLAWVFIEFGHTGRLATRFQLVLIIEFDLHIESAKLERVSRPINIYG